MDRIEQLRKFIDAQPEQPFPRYALALELKGKGDAAAAAAEMKELLRRAPGYLAAYLMYGLLLQALCIGAYLFVNQLTEFYALAVVFEPPATGAGGRSLSPSSTETDDKGMPSRSAAICPMTV